MMTKWKVAVAVMLFAFTCSCGGAGGTDAGTPVVVESVSASSDSYLPLAPGTLIRFSSGPIREGSTTTVEGLTVEVADGGIVKILGRRISGDEIADITETLEFEENDSSVFLSAYNIDVTYSDGRSFNSSRTYAPHVLFLINKLAISTGMINTNTGVDVTYEGDPETVTFFSGGEGNIEAIPISTLEDATTTVEMKGMENISIADVAHDVYLLEFGWDMENRELWFPLSFLSGGRFGLAKGVGIVRVAGQDAGEVNLPH